MAASQTRVQGFDWLRFFAIVAVVGIHCSDIAVRKNSYFPTMTPEGILHFALHAVLRFCVPAFLMMSAFLAESRVQKTGEDPAMRWKRLAFPCVVVGIFYTVLSLAEAKLQHKPLSVSGVLQQTLSGQAYYHTWYVFIALVFVLLHRFLRVFASGVLFVLLIIGATVLYAQTNGWIEALDAKGPFGGITLHLLMAFPYYVAGIWFAHNLERIRAVPSPYVIAGLMAGFGAAIFSAVQWRIRTFYSPGYELFAIAVFVFALRVQKSPPAWLSNFGAYSLGIYLWHPFFLTVFRVLQGRFYREAISPTITLGLMFLEIAVGLTGGLLTARLLARTPALRGLAQ